MGLEIKPRSCNTLFTAPLVPNSVNAKANTSTQLIKLGRVVTVCTNLRKGLHLISLRNTANTIGNQLKAREMPLMAKVLRSTRITFFKRTGLFTMVANHLNPTNVSFVMGKGGR